MTTEQSQKPRFIHFLQHVKRSRNEKKLGGVCGGLAAHSDVPAWVYRSLFITLLLLWGLGGVAYIALWICMPVEEVFESVEQTTAQSVNTPAVQ